MKIAICDDDINVVEFLYSRCAIYCEDSYSGIKSSVVAFDNVLDLLKTTELFDIIFLDVEIGNENGIEAAKQIRVRDKQVQIILISGHKEYKPLAFSIHPFDYLDKPITDEKISKVLDELRAYQLERREEEFIVLKTNSGIVKLILSEIKYFEYLNRKIYVYTYSGAFELYGNLKGILAEIAKHGFGMPHRAFVVNYKFVQLIEVNRMILVGDTEIHISRLRLKQIKEEFFSYLTKQIN